MAIAETKDNSREAWLAERRTGIGGSDAAAVIGLSDWTTPLQVYLDKRGELPPTEPSPAMLWGTLLEPVLRQRYADLTGLEIIRHKGIQRHPKMPFVIASLDGIAGDRLLELKTARTDKDWGEPGTDEIPLAYRIQVQHYLAVTGLSLADIAVLIGGQDFRIYTVEADRILQDSLLEQEAEFWERVQQGFPPDPVTPDDVKTLWRQANGTTLDASMDVETNAAASSLAIVKKEIEDLKAMEEALKTALQKTMGPADCLIGHGGRVLATWKNVNAAPRFDKDAFREQHPDLWKEFLRPPGPQRQFLLKIKPEKK